MLDLLYEIALKDKERLQGIMGNFEETRIRPELWTNHKFNENPTKRIAAGDGSINKTKYLPFIFYAIGAEAILHTGDGLNYVQSSKVDVMPRYKYADDRLRNYMGIIESKNTLKMLIEHDVDLFLFDGSLLGDLIRPYPFQIRSEVKGEIRELIHRKHLPQLADLFSIEWKQRLPPKILSALFQPKIEKELENSVEAMIYLEHLENLLVLSELMRHGKKMVAISKTSTSTECFNEKIPDMALYEMHSRNEGYSRPRHVQVNDKKREFPVEDGFLNSLTFTIFYARLADHKNILKFEVPYHLAEEDIPALLGYVKSVSAEGYPLLLKKAHDDVVIRRNDLERLSTILELRAKRGREVVE